MHKFNDNSYPQSKGRHNRIIVASSTIEVNSKIKEDEKSRLKSSIGGVGGNKSSTSSLDELDSTKNKVTFEHS